MLTVRCPQCHHDQLFDPRINSKTPTVVGKRKRCVYCGFSISVHTNQVKSNIVAVGKVADPNRQF